MTETTVGTVLRLYQQFKIDLRLIEHWSKVGPSKIRPGVYLIIDRCKMSKTR